MADAGCLLRLTGIPCSGQRIYENPSPNRALVGIITDCGEDGGNTYGASLTQNCRGLSMNLWLRLLWLFVSAPFRPKLEMPGGTSILRFRVWPHDLDLSLHMNNGRYLTIMDQGRLDVMVQSGFLRGGGP